MAGLHLERDPAQITRYLTDASRMPGGQAEELGRPASHDEAREMLRAWAAAGVPVTVSGAGTGLCGGRVPLGGAVLAMDGLRRIGEPRPDDEGARRGTVRVGAGVTLDDVAAAVEPHGWLYPLDPTERTAAAGGMVGTDASGPWGLRSGSTRRLVRSLRGILADGRAFRVARAGASRGASPRLPLDDGTELALPPARWSGPAIRKSTAGYARATDVVDLLVGSEGTLAAITEIELGLVPRPPAFVCAVFFFSAEPDALRFVARLAAGPAEAPAAPWSLELLDRASLALAREADPALPGRAAAAVSLDRGLGEADDEAAILDAWSDAAARSGEVTDAVAGTSPVERERFRAVRHAVPAAINERLARRAVPKVATDTAVPRDALADWLAGTRRRLEQDGLEHYVFGHAGDANLHVNIVPASPGELPEAIAARDAIVRLALRAGGTCAAEHGIGKLRRAALREMFEPAEIEAMRAVRRAFDPAERLGRGTMFALEAGP